MKICILTSSIREGYGGWARYSLEVLKELQNRPDIKIIIITEDNSSHYRIKKVGNGFSLTKDILTNAIYVRKLSRDCKIIHALDGYPYGIIAYLASLGRKKQKLFITAIGTYTTAPLNNRYIGWLLKLAYKKAKKIFAISNFTANKLKKNINLPNIVVIHMGANHNILKAEPTPADEKNIPSNFILSVGDLKPRKGYHISLPAFAQISQKYPDLYYIIVGYQFNREYFNQLQTLVSDNNIKDRVMFISNINDNKLNALYRRAKILILTSLNDDKHYEGFGLVYIEAGLFGIPAIGSNNCGTEDAIINEQTGYLIEQKNIGLLAEKMDGLLADESKRQKMGKNAQKFANNFQWSKTIDAYLKYYG